MDHLLKLEDASGQLEHEQALRRERIGISADLKRWGVRSELLA
jgi:hypothetical protein